MLNDILKLEGVTKLNRSAQKFINGGEGNCGIQCKSGVMIHNAPNLSDEVMDFACANQGGASYGICTGPEIPWENPR